MAQSELSLYQRVKQAGHRITYLPLESDPEIFTELIQKLGVDGFEFQDVMSLDPELLDFVPRPVHALILTFPCRGEAWQDALEAKEQSVAVYEGKGEEEPVVWFAQTIQNACGLYAILHSLANGIDRSKIRSGSPFDNFLKNAIPLAPAERAKALEASEEIKAIHTQAAEKGGSAIPEAEAVDYHYICFVKSQKDNHVYELNGTAKGPIDTGVISYSNDLLTGDSLELVRNYMKSAPEDIGFSLMALVPANA
ncbi:hypothetical protein NMY22_g13292 [Coprinellus aureogranulatus]|nr:hypothetical protein NMY22_g13292 [Coprinellus aureogranulatus]